MNTKILALCAALLAGLVACDSGTWADVPGPVGGCKGGKPNGLGMESPADIKIIAQGLCASRQKNYTGDFQCKGEDLQVKCKGSSAPPVAVGAARSQGIARRLHRTFLAIGDESMNEMVMNVVSFEALTRRPGGTVQSAQVRTPCHSPCSPWVKSCNDAFACKTGPKGLSGARPGTDRQGSGDSGQVCRLEADGRCGDGGTSRRARRGEEGAKASLLMITPPMTRLLLAVFSAISVMFIATACGLSAQWVSVPLLTGPGKEWNDIKKNVDLQKMLGPTRGGKAVKSYANDWRFESGVVEVKCK